MYPPPQSDVVIDSHSRPVSGEHGTKFGFDFIRAQMKQHSDPPPFSYEYVLEDGKMPTLAEFHAVDRNSAAGVSRSGSTRSVSHSRPQRRPVPMNRSSSYTKPEKQPFSIDSLIPSELAADKLKRAFSLASGRTSTQPSRQPSTASRRERTHAISTQPSRNVSQSSRRQAASTAGHNTNARQSTTPSESRVPSLVLPTPTPSPTLMHSDSSSPQKSPMNFGIPNVHVYGASRPFSWAYNDDSIDDDHDDYDDFDDLIFLQQNGMGRVHPSYRPMKQFRKEKAFELLGIASKDKSVPQTPALSAATSSRPSPASSDRDHLSRNSSRMSRHHQNGGWSPSTQVEYAGGHQNRISTPKASPNASVSEEETPRPPKHIRQQIPRKSLSNPISKPVFVRQSVADARPKSIAVLNHPIPPTSELHSAPPNLTSKPASPNHASSGAPLVLAEPQPLPASVAKVSRFIEHLDANAKRLSLSIPQTSPTSARPAFLEARSFIDPDVIAPAPRRATSPLPSALRSPPSPRALPAVATPVEGTFNTAVAAAAVRDKRPSAERELSTAGVRRSVSMREPASAPWVAVVCTAQARPIVATGHAKIV